MLPCRQSVNKHGRALLDFIIQCCFQHRSHLRRSCRPINKNYSMVCRWHENIWYIVVRRIKSVAWILSKIFAFFLFLNFKDVCVCGVIWFRVLTHLQTCLFSIFHFGLYLFGQFKFTSRCCSQILTCFFYVV